MPKRKENTEIVIQSNNLLEAPLFKKSLQLKMFSKIIVAIRKDKNKDTYTFPVTEILEEFEMGGDNFTYLKQECKKMFRVLDVSEKGKKGFHLTVLFVDIKVNGEGIISFKPNPDLKPLILDLSKGRYTKYYLENIARLKSSYSIRIYELLKQYQKIGFREISVIDLKYYLAIDKNLYKRYNDFKKNTILLAQKELEDKTDIYFEFKEKKTGRKITHIEFKIFTNRKNTVDENKLATTPKTASKENKEIYDELVLLGITENKATKIIEEYTEERLLNNIKYTKSEHEKGKIKNNVTGFLNSAIKNDYYSQIKLPDLEIKNKRKVKEKKEHEEKERLGAKKVKEKREKKRVEIEAFICSSDKKILLEIDKRFAEENTSNIMISKYLKNGVINTDIPAVKFSYYDFVYNNYMAEIVK